MKRSKKDTLISIVILLAFFIQLKRGFNPPELEPGMIPGGLFLSTEEGIVVSAILSALLVWGILELLFWVYTKIRKK
ncbi:Uncharacterised protein [uncultured Clostridium sp.]|uniref:hypothetical protein n=1 Tax=Flintibacter sp. HCN-6482 TaxID=3134672 RepID=UPI0008202B3B|nr:Uncharacterised protein [uncultured Clostridium sp.]